MSKYPTSILITGGTQGLGYFCARFIAQKQPNTLVVVASRTDPGNSAATINAELKQSNVKFMKLDLGTLATVRSFATAWKSGAYPPIQALVLNAGLQFPGDISYSSDGIEKTFAINHVGHALLYHLLRENLAADARIVVTASGVHDPAMKSGITGHYTNAADVAQPSADSIEKSYGRGRYATSKIANVLWAYALARRLAASPKTKGQTVTVMDPGLMPGTNLGREAPAVARWLFVTVFPRIIPFLRFLLRTQNVHLPAESGAALARLAVGEDVKGVSGKYFEGVQEIKSSVQSYQVDLQEELWEWTVEFVGSGKEERERFRRGE
ncbi:NAD(P)-binding protein [Melanomma pulvis-pyrius CBS 109.77]|uniref:NAD(P)-binding protein n=1 Tax=Melanomma pulvis-pyrius CBS 109.77 TaxID=1314802 RepID=A0A6A6X4S5_9PLEO|nr:NAD(P)-binding protein [Melanomma pulvis-pyrius CBS 109.77]